MRVIRDSDQSDQAQDRDTFFFSFFFSFFFFFHLFSVFLFLSFLFFLVLFLFFFFPKAGSHKHLMSAQRGVSEARDGSVCNDMGNMGGWGVGQVARRENIRGERLFDPELQAA